MENYIGNYMGTILSFEPGSYIVPHVIYIVSQFFNSLIVLELYNIENLECQC